MCKLIEEASIIIIAIILAYREITAEIWEFWAIMILIAFIDLASYKEGIQKAGGENDNS